MPLSKLQTEILKLLASHRDPESYIAGATPLNRSGPRFSNDIDIFHDRQERVTETATRDIASLRDAGYDVTLLRELPSLRAARVSIDGISTRLEWVADSDFRYFPIVRDSTFGYVLHPVDLAMNKAMAAAGRRELRDIVDLVTVHRTILPLGAVIWAAVEKSPGFTPEGLIAEIRRNSHYPIAEWRALASAEPLEPAGILQSLRKALDEAEAFVIRMPTDKAGLLFLHGADVVQPDPDHLSNYRTHAGQRFGHWPNSPEISAAMFEKAAQL